MIPPYLLRAVLKAKLSTLATEDGIDLPPRLISEWINELMDAHDNMLKGN